MQYLVHVCVHVLNSVITLQSQMSLLASQWFFSYLNPGWTEIKFKQISLFLPALWLQSNDFSSFSVEGK